MEKNTVSTGRAASPSSAPACQASSAAATEANASRPPDDVYVLKSQYAQRVAHHGTWT